MALIFIHLAVLFVLQSLSITALASGLGIVTPCPDCGSSIAPAPVTITAQYQVVSTCLPSVTTEHSPNGKHIKLQTIPSCSQYAWVSTAIPTYSNNKRGNTLITSTNQPVTFNGVHYTETHTTTLSAGPPSFNSTRQNHTSVSTRLSETTIDVKSVCDYSSIGPLAIPGYGGSGLCTNCGPDIKHALTQKFTVVSCANQHCTTFDETWINSPTMYTSGGTTHTTTKMDKYGPTATPWTAIPGLTVTAAKPPTETVSTSIGILEDSGAVSATQSHVPSYSAPVKPTTRPIAYNTVPAHSVPSHPHHHPPPQNSPPPAYSSTIPTYPPNPTPPTYQQQPTPYSPPAPPALSTTCTSQSSTIPTYSTPEHTHTHIHPTAPAYSTPKHTNPTLPPYSTHAPPPTYSSPPPPDPSGDMDYDDPPTPTPYSPPKYHSPPQHGHQTKSRVIKRGGVLYWGAE